MRQARRKKGEGFGRRHILVGAIFFLWMVGIGWRLYHLQVVRHAELSARAAAQRERKWELAPPRGEIVDRNGTVLAQSVMGSILIADPKAIRASNHDPRRYAEILAAALGEKDSEDLLAGLSSERRYVRLRRRLDPEKVAAVRRAMEEHKLVGLALEQEPIRVYPNKSLAAHVIGYVNADEEGQAGLEMSQEKYLRGAGGTIHYETDALGRPYDRREAPAREGARVVTTIDLGLQHRVEALLELAWRETRSKAASAVVLDIKTGEILALAAFPSHDPNVRPKFKDGPRREAELEARRNRVITDYYEPGSVFKVVTFSAALEEGLARPEEKINCLNGRIELFGRVIGDHVSGWLTTSEALAKSSNVGAIQLALRVARRHGEGKLVEYMRRFGFGERTEVDLPGEIRGVVHPAKNWHRTSIGSVAIGQEVGVTVLQMVAAMAAIGNGGVWVQPHVVRQVVGPDDQIFYEAQPKTRRVISEKTAAAISRMLEQVVVAGTARHAVKLTGYTAAGKTGTPQKVDPVTKRYSHTKFMPTFAGFVPASDPRFAIIVMLDEPIGLHQGGQVSAPVFKSIAETALLDYGITPDQPEFRQSLDLLAAELREKMNKRDASAGEAGQVIDGSEAGEAGATVAPDRGVIASGQQRDEKDARAGGQTGGGAAKGEPFVSAKQVALPQDIDPTVMPDLRGRSVREVAQLCTRLDLRANLIGKGIARRQVPAPGARIEPGDICRVEFQ